MTYVCFSPIPNGASDEPLYPMERQREIEKIKNPTVRREKYFAWKLLEKAVRLGMRLDFKSLKFNRLEDGRWLSPDFYFSISHSGGALAVAISSEPLGIDIEPLGRGFSEGLVRRYFTEGEKEHYCASSEEHKEECALRIWTAKEAYFKSLSRDKFEPSRVDTSGISYASGDIDISGSKFIYSLYSEKLDFEILPVDLSEN